MFSGVALFHHHIRLCWTDTPIFLEITRVTQANIYLAWTRKRHSNSTCLPDVSKRHFMAGAPSLFSERADFMFIFPYCLSKKNLDMMPYPLPKTHPWWQCFRWFLLKHFTLKSSFHTVHAGFHNTLCPLFRAVDLRTYFVHSCSTLFNPHQYQPYSFSRSCHTIYNNHTEQ